MYFSWIIGFFLLANSIQTPDPFIITENGETIAVVNREEISLKMPGLDLVDPVQFEKLVEQIELQIKKEPVDASISDAGRLVPEKVGHKLNRHAFEEQFFRYFYQQTSNTFEVPKISLYPKIDSELLSIIRTKRIGQYITYYNPRKTSRSNNISLAVDAINNQVVFPGETFSFNTIVGKRTMERGYMKAPEIVKGELIEGVGGGICQVSSTLFNAVDLSGIKIMERFSHSKHVRYVPPGRDATVSWYGPDFTFKNEYNQPILIRARAIDGRVTVIIYSSEDVNHASSDYSEGSFVHKSNFLSSISRSCRETSNNCLFSIL
jgi:vancomycin resistance protein YoaR